MVTNVDQKILKKLKEVLSGYRGKVVEHDEVPWIACIHEPLKQSLAHLLTKGFLLRLAELRTWTDCTYHQYSLRDGHPLLVDPLAQEQPVPPPQQVPLRAITRKHWCLPSESALRCDLICLVVSSIMRGDACELIVWDGTLEGTFSVEDYLALFRADETASGPLDIDPKDGHDGHSDGHGAGNGGSNSTISNGRRALLTAGYHNLCQSLHAAAVLAGQLKDPSEVNSFYPTILLEDFSATASKGLHGRPACLVTGDHFRMTALAQFTPGTWIRVRNVHLDYAPSIRSGPPPVSRQGIEVVGSIYADTRITPLLPFYRYSCTPLN
jgi:hypothetical protein